MNKVEQLQAIAEDWEESCRACHEREIALYNDLVGVAYDLAESQVRVAELEARIAKLEDKPATTEGQRILLEIMQARDS